MKHTLTRALAEALPRLGQASANIAEGRFNTFEKGSPVDTAIKTIVGNADLLMAAPELLDTLERCKQFLLEVHCRWPEDADYGGSVLNDVNDVIAKATDA